MRYLIVKRVEAKSLAEAIKKESKADIIEISVQEDPTGPTGFQS